MCLLEAGAFAFARVVVVANTRAAYRLTTHFLLFFVLIVLSVAVLRVLLARADD
ncbi:MAG: hypothetical protein NVS4B11_17860 [Ktedonobacteraceae bacterium]